MMNQDIRDMLIIFQNNEFLVIFFKNCGKFCYYASQKKFQKFKKKSKRLNPAPAYAHDEQDEQE